MLSITGDQNQSITDGTEATKATEATEATDPGITPETTTEMVK